MDRIFAILLVYFSNLACVPFKAYTRATSTSISVSAGLHFTIRQRATVLPLHGDSFFFLILESNFRELTKIFRKITNTFFQTYKDTVLVMVSSSVNFAADEKSRNEKRRVYSGERRVKKLSYTSRKALKSLHETRGPPETRGSSFYP